MEWCQARGKAHHTSEPRIAWPNVNGKMFRSFENSQAIPAPPINVKGTSTGFGQCNTPKIVAATRTAFSGFSNAASSRFVRNELSATCWRRQNARYPPKRFMLIKWAGKRWSMPRNSPPIQIRMEHTPKKQSARFVADHRLSARQPIVLGVSWRARKLTSTQTTITAHVQGSLAWSFQMYQATNPENANPSMRHDQGLTLQFTRDAPRPSSSALAVPRSVPADSGAISRFRHSSPRDDLETGSTQNRGSPGSSFAPVAARADAAPVFRR